MVDLGQDIGFPQWVFGQSCFAFLEGGRVVFVYSDGGLERLAVWEPDSARSRDVDIDLTPDRSTAGPGPSGVTIAASGVERAARRGIVDVDDDSVEVLVPSSRPRRSISVRPCGPSRPIDFHTAGGATAHALSTPRQPGLRRPADERPPLIVMIHGGPTAAARPTLDISTQYWTSRGFAVVDVNYGGSTGYGRDYRDLLRGAWGVVDVEDCAAVCEFLVARGDADPDRLCIRGGSAGGFTTLAALTFHDVFAAGASHYGVADLAVLAAETHKFESRYLDGLVGPWPEARSTYEARSPIFHTDRIDRPLAVFQGLDDPIVPPNQAEMIVEALRAKGVPVAYLAFEGEGHGFRQAQNIRAALDGELSFYAQVLGFDLPPDEAIEPIEAENLEICARIRPVCGRIRSCSADPAEDQRWGGSTGSGDLDGAVEGLQGGGEAGGVVEVQLEERLALLHPVAHRRPPDDAGGGGDGVLLAGPARAEAPGGHADGHGVEPGEGAGGRRRDHLDLVGPGERSGGVAALAAPSPARRPWRARQPGASPGSTGRRARPGRASRGPAPA